MNPNRSVALGNAIAAALICFPCILGAFATLGVASWHGDGLAPVVAADVLLAIAIFVLSRRSARFARALPFFLVVLLTGLIIQALFALRK